jgi:hypothetical protein
MKENANASAGGLMVRDDGEDGHMNALRSGIDRLRTKYRHVESGFKYILLCLYIALTILVLPFLGLSIWLIIALDIIFAAAVFCLLFRVDKARDVRILVVLLCAAAIFERLTFMSGRTQLRLAGLSVTLVVVAVLTAYFFFTVVLTRNPIRAHIIWAAISVYLLLGILYAIGYEILGAVSTGAVIFNSNPAQVLSTTDYIYYSYSTLFTLSYGDYIPIAQIARAMALLEVLIGVFFMAIIIAKLVGYTGLPGYDEGDGGGDHPEKPLESDRRLAEMNDRLSRMERMLATLHDGKKRD